MNKRTIYAIIFLLFGFSMAHVIQVYNLRAAAFPSTDYPWTLNDILDAGWLNTVEEILGPWPSTTTNIYAQLTSSTSPLGSLYVLSSSTGNLIVGSSSDWITKATGTQGYVLTVSSTAQGGINWEASGAFSTSSAHEWAGLQGFNGGIDFTTATGTSATSTLSIGTSSIQNLYVGTLTASRLLQSSASRYVQAVADLTSWIAGTASEITVADDGDGTVTISLPTTVDLGASSNLTTVGFNFTNATGTNLTITTLVPTNTSGTNISVSGYGLFPLLSFTSATGTNLTITTLLDSQGNKYTTSTIANFLFTNATGTNITATTILDSQGTKFVTSTNAATYPFRACYGNEVSNSVDIAKQFISTSTVGTTVLAGNFKSGGGEGAASGTVTFNLGFATSTSNATSTWQKLFTSDQAVTSDGANTVLTVNGSTTWSGASGQRWSLGYYTTANSSSSEFCFEGNYTIN